MGCTTSVSCDTFARNLGRVGALLRCVQFLTDTDATDRDSFGSFAMSASTSITTVSPTPYPQI